MELLQEGDTLIDGGNSYYKDDMQRASEVKQKGISYLDVGTSGGVWGRERGYCMMMSCRRNSPALWLSCSCSEWGEEEINFYFKLAERR